MNFARLSAVTVLALTLVMPHGHAAEPSALAPGKPAGVKQADIWDPMTLGVIVGGTALVVGFALAISSTTPPTTSIGGASGNSVVFTATTTQ